MASNGRGVPYGHPISQAAEHLNGHPTRRPPNTLNVSIDGTTAQEVLAGAPGIAASAGSACHEGHTTPSPVLTAMGLPVDRA